MAGVALIDRPHLTMLQKDWVKKNSCYMFKEGPLVMNVCG